MTLFLKKYARTLLDILVLIGIIVFIMWFGELVFRIASPIVFGYFIFLLMEPLTRIFVNRKIKRSISTIISLSIILILVLGVFSIIGIVFVTQVEMIIHNFNKYYINIEKFIVENVPILREQINNLPPDVLEKVNSSLNSISSSLVNFSTKFLRGTIGYISSFSIMSIKFLIGIILAFFLSIEIDEIKGFMRKNSPKTLIEVYSFLKTKVFSQLGKYLKAQFKLISITFFIVFFGLLILRVNNTFTISIISAIFDILPLLGVSTIFVPWILYVFIIKGNTVLGIGLTILWLVVIAFRQIAEPKIVGDSLGVSAFFMLSAMTIFLTIFGVAGVILTPILIILIKELYKNGYLSKWITKPEGEY